MHERLTQDGHDLGIDLIVDDDTELCLVLPCVADLEDQANGEDDAH